MPLGVLCAEAAIPVGLVRGLLGDLCTRGPRALVERVDVVNLDADSDRYGAQASRAPVGVAGVAQVDDPVAATHLGVADIALSAGGTEHLLEPERA